MDNNDKTVNKNNVNVAIIISHIVELQLFA